MAFFLWSEFCGVFLWFCGVFLWFWTFFYGFGLFFMVLAFFYGLTYFLWFSNFDGEAAYCSGLEYYDAFTTSGHGVHCTEVRFENAPNTRD